MKLKDIVEMKGDIGKKISFLKVDVEGAEIKAMSEWIESGILDQVQQIGIEIHTGTDYIEEKDIVETLYKFIDNFKKLHSLGFRFIFTSLNDCTGRDNDLKKEYTPFYELVFYKPTCVIKT